ncbi:hypothetical protein TNCT_386941 [Trichonephila clavata]|uniref:Uncharacterized protein n=1 Tax=Trichonephila clavata TaxID=2740835 RepID=A0A8X6G7Q9_TRICU|nr:hypothetical protein TNCT_386941 [Trichonephila clavata]
MEEEFYRRANRELSDLRKWKKRLSSRDAASELIENHFLYRNNRGMDASGSSEVDLFKGDCFMAGQCQGWRFFMAADLFL